MSKHILGLDLGSNSVGWALLNEENRQINRIVDCGVRIFPKSVKEDDPIPKNKKRRDMRLGRRVLQRRARRKQNMLNYLISLDLLPKALKERFNTEKQLNDLGNPYQLRTKGLDEQLEPHEFGRILLHFVARRGFFSSKKQLAGDLIDDPDTFAYLKEEEEKETAELLAKGKKPKADDQSEGAFKTDIATVYQAIKDNQCRSLGEYLYQLDAGKVKRNRQHEGGHLRTDRAMYQDELEKIWAKQQPYFDLPDDFMEKITKIIFYQRPLKLKKDRVGKCSLEPENYRAAMARLEVQQFRYLQDINNLTYGTEFEKQPLNNEQKQQLAHYLEHNKNLNITNFRKLFGFDRKTTINLETKNLKGNTTACDIRDKISNIWDGFDEHKQKALVEDLFSIVKKSTLKKRLINHWGFDAKTAVELCLTEFETGHSNLSLKAINKILPHLKDGVVYSKKDKDTGELGALQSAGYDDENKDIEPVDKLPAPIETANPIVNKGLHELKRLVNALIKEHGKPDVIRIEMARDLEMNTDRYKDNEAMQKKNKAANEEAEAEYLKYHPQHSYATKEQKLRYKLWQEQDHRCVYSGNCIPITQLWTADIHVDHIVPKSRCLDDSYTNKVVCKVAENTTKGRRTPIEAWGDDEDKWHQISQGIEKFYPGRPSKKYRKSKTNPKKKQFLMRQKDIDEKYGMSAAQLNDTRYISKLAQEYLAQLGCDISVTKGAVVAEVRYLWGLNSLIGQTNKKERTDHRHHTIDAAVIACMDLGFHNRMTQAIKHKEETGERLKFKAPYAGFKNEVQQNIDQIIVSHDVQRKLSGGLHEETGAGFLALKDSATGQIIKQGLVYRKNIDQAFTLKNADRIVDEEVRDAVLEHISNYDTTKAAFVSKELAKIKLGKNPIKRVRVWQSEIKPTKKQTAKDLLAKTKFGVKDKSGKIFKWMAFGNYHHVEIIKHKTTDKIKGVFITMMTASARAKGIGMSKQAIANKEHGEDYELLFTLHRNDLVSIKNEQGQRVYYRVQQLDGLNKKIVLRLHTASTLKNKNEELNISISQENFDKYQLQLHKINAIGQLLNDQAGY